MQDATTWLFPSTKDATSTSEQLQPGPKSRHLTERFNLLFRRTKQTPPQSAAHLPTSCPHPDLQGAEGATPGASNPPEACRRPGVGKVEEDGVRTALEGQILTGPGGSSQQPRQTLLPQQHGSSCSAQLPYQSADSPSPGLAPLPSQDPASLPADQGLFSSSSSSQGVDKLPHQQVSGAQGRLQLPSQPSSSPFPMPGGLQPRGQGALVLTSQPEWSSSSFQGRGVSPYQPSSVTPAKEEQHQQGRASTSPGASGPSPGSVSFTSPLQVVPAQACLYNPPQPLPVPTSSFTGQHIWAGDLTTRQPRPLSGQDNYQPGMYDGFASVSSRPVQGQQQDQQLMWQQGEQLPAQLPQQQQHILDLSPRGLVTGDQEQALFGAQHAQRAQHSSGVGPGSSQAYPSYPQLAQQVPFYESSPQYMPSTLTPKPPIFTRVALKMTNLLGFPKQQPHPSDLEAGTTPPLIPPNPEGREPPPGCSPKSALLRSGIFSNPKASTQEKQISPEQAERRARGLVRTRVEPKVFFANERTFLQWLQISVLIMFTGLSLLGGSSLSQGGSSAGGSGAACDSTACKASKVGKSTAAGVASSNMDMK